MSAPATRYFVDVVSSRFVADTADVRHARSQVGSAGIANNEAAVRLGKSSKKLKDIGGYALASHLIVANELFSNSEKNIIRVQFDHLNSVAVFA